MKKSICILVLCFVLHASPVIAAAYGPLWRIWTHSKDSNECNIKTAFWFTSGIIGMTLIVNKINEKYKMGDRIKLTSKGLTIYWK